MNKKGISTIEILITFTIVMIISISIFEVVASYRIKADIAYQRNELTTLKNILTKDILKNITEDEVTSVSTCSDGDGCVEFEFRDGTSKKLIVNTSDPRNKTIEYDEYIYDIHDRIPITLPTGTTAKDFETIEVDLSSLLSIKNYTENTKNKQIYKIRVGIKHVDLDEHFDINITTTTGRITQARPYVYGIRVNTNTGTFERLDDAVGMNATVGTDTLNPINSFDDAEIYKQIEKVTEDGNEFIKIPKFYIKKTVTANAWEIRISKEKVDSNYYLPESFKPKGVSPVTENDYVLIGKYNASLNGSKLESKTGVTPIVNKTLAELRTAARAAGPNYQLLDIHAIDVIQTLFFIEFGTMNSQEIMYGYADSDNEEPLINGQSDTVKSKSGSKSSNSNGKNAMMYRGIENIYGNLWQMVDGINIRDSKAYVAKDPSLYASDTYTGAYQPVNYLSPTTYHYVTTIGYDPNHPYLNLATAVGPKENSFINDYFYMKTGDRIGFFGGNWYDSDLVGIGYWYFNYESNSTYTTVGTRIIKMQ